MKDSETTTVVLLGAVILTIVAGALFFDIIGVFGFAFAIAGLVLAVAVVIAIGMLRPAEDQAQ